MINGGRWKKASRSHQPASDCVECLHAITGVYIRDSKEPEEDALYFPVAGWHAFLRDVVSGKLDR